MAAEWQTCLHFDVTDGRRVKTFLGKGGRLLVSDDVDIVCVRAHSVVGTYQTTRNGTRLDVVPDVPDSSVPLNSAIKRHQAVWMRRVPELSPDMRLTGGFFPEIPIITKYRMLAAEEACPGGVTVLSDKTNDDSEEMDSVDKDASSFAPVREHLVPGGWSGLLTQSTKAMSWIATSAATVYISRSRRSIWISVIGALSVYCVSSYYFLEAGPLMSLAVHSEEIMAWLQWIYECLRQFLIIGLWICCVLVICYVLYRILRVLDWLTKWLETSVEVSEIDSTSEMDSPQRPLSIPPNPLGSSSMAEELFAPSVIVSVSPSSMADPADDGAGPFRSEREKDVCSAAVAPTLPTSTQPNCMAGELYPADGSSVPVSSSVCMDTNISLIMVLGGELVMSHGSMSMIPETGKRMPMCAIHARAYDERSQKDACQSSECYRRGFSLVHGGRPIVTCAVHLQELLAKAQDEVQTTSNKPASIKPNDGHLPERTSVSWKPEKAYHFPAVAEETKRRKKTAEVVSPSSSSESWDSREQEIQNLFGGKTARRSSTQSVRETLSSQRSQRTEHSRKEKKERSARSASSDTSIESRVDLFRRSLSKRNSQRSIHRSSSNGSDGAQGRRRRRPTSFDSSQLDSADDCSDHVSHHSVHSGSRVRLPAFLRQPIPRGTAAPVEIKADPKLHKRKKRGWECIADALSANHVLKEGEKEATSTRLLERTLFAMRGFGQFKIDWGVGCYGTGFTECIRAIATDHAEDLRLHNIRCKITNRIAHGISNLKCGSKKAGTEDEKNILLGDFAPVPTSVLEDFVLTDTKAEPRPKQPQDVEMFRRCVENQTNVWCLFFGQEYRAEREECMASLIGLHEDVPELFSVQFIVATWEAFTYDYVYKMFEGMRRLGQFCRPSDDIVEIRRLALNRHPDGGIIWQPPFSFDMSSSQGYWRRNIIPRLEAGVERQGYASALDKVLGKVAPKSRLRGKQKLDSTVGAVNKDLFPLTEKLNKAEMNMALQNCPRKAKSGNALCLDYNAHAGCQRGADCRFCHEYFGGKNLHWCIEAELIRRGGFRKRKTMISDPKEARTLIADLREKNARVLGEQILESKQGLSDMTVGGQERSNGGNVSTHVCYRTNPVHVPICPTLDLPEFVNVEILQNPTTQVSTECDWWDDEDQRKTRRQAFNQYFTSLPNDFEHFDFVESEQLINDLVHTDDKWTYPARFDGQPVENEPLSDLQLQVEMLWNDHAAEIDPLLHAFIVNWLTTCCVKRETVPSIDMICHSLMYLQEHGSDRDKLAATRALDLMEHKVCYAVGNVDRCMEITWGSKVKLIDGESEEITFGTLRFHVLDFGDVLDLNEGLKEAIACGVSVEKNQCAILAMAAGIEWSLQGRPHRAPSLTRIQFAAMEIRGEEIAMVKKLTDPMPRLLKSAIHDVVTLGHDRDIRIFNWFLIPVVRGYVQCEIRVVEISRNQRMSVVHVFPCADSTSEPLFFVAFRGHLRWMMPTMYSRPKEWKLWRKAFHHIIDQSPEDGFSFKERYVEITAPPYRRCDHCPSWNKVDITEWRVGGDGQTANDPSNQSQPMHRSTNRIPRVINGVEVFPAPTMRAPQPRPSVVSTSEPPKIYDDSDLKPIFDGFPTVDRHKSEIHGEPVQFPIADHEWRVATPHQLAYAYCDRVDCDFSLENLQQIIRAGTDLMHAVGGFLQASRHVQEIQIRRQQDARLYLESKRHLFPAIAEEVDEVFRLGVSPPFENVRSTGHDEGFPHDRSKTRAIVESLWKDIRLCKVLVVETEEIPTHERIEFCPTHTVLKRNPDRSWSSEFRTISDLRRVNLWLDKRDTFPVWVPGITDILKRVTALKTTYPGFKVLMAKRDISNAFKRVLVHPDIARLFMHQFEGKDMEMEVNFSIGFLALPFGFLASPAFFNLITTTIQAIHKSMKPNDPVWNGPENYECFLYVDDAIFVEAELGSRPQDSLNCWVSIAREVLGQDCINEQKVIEEGAWQTRSLVLGFIIDTERMTIEVPPLKVESAALFVLSEDFGSPYVRLRLKTVQVLRGLMTHWLNASLFWRACVQPVDAMLSFQDEKAEFLVCPDPEIVSAFWSMMRLLKYLAGDREVWRTLFRGEIARVLEAQLRFTSPNDCTSSVWLTGDATLRTISSINWTEKQFVKCTPWELLKEFSGGLESEPIIAEVELAAGICGVILWAGICGEKRVIVVGTDNSNVFSWLRRGKARVGKARRMLTAFLLWTVKYDIEIIPFFLRTHHNLSADLITRCDDPALTAWMNRFGMTRVSVPWWWSSFAKMGEVIPWGNDVARTVQIVPELAPGACDITVAEWGGSNFLPLQCAKLFGCQTLALTSRWKDLTLNYDRFPYWRNERVDVLLGTAKTVTECKQFGQHVHTINAGFSVLVTPSELVPPNLDAMGFTQHFWVDSGFLSDVLCGAWNVFIRGSIVLKELRQPSTSGQPSCLGEWMSRADMSLKEDEVQEVKKKEIENSQGTLKFWTDSKQTLRLHSTSQLRALTKKELSTDLLRWPMKVDGTECSNADKLSILGCHEVWKHRLLWPAEEVTDAVWRSTPLTLWCVTLRELIGRKSEWFEKPLPPVVEMLTTEAPHVVAGSRTRDRYNRDDFLEDEEAKAADNWWFVQEFDSRVGGKDNVAAALQKIHEEVHGIEKIEALLGGLAQGTTTAYRRAWRHWILFCTGTGIDPWMDYTKRGWDEIMLDFIMHEHRVLGLQAKSIRSKISGIRYFHIMAGYGDFAPMGVRYKQLLSAISKDVPTARKFPFGPEMFMWLRNQVMHMHATSDIIEAWAALIIGFNFLLRGAEVMNLRWQDLSILRDDDDDYLLLCIRRSKTDTKGMGVFRSLFANWSALCPVRVWKSYCALYPGHVSIDFVFNRVVLHRMRTLIKWTASGLGMDPRFFAVHSLRAGGASTLFANGASLDEIRRFGRWKSDSFHSYLHGDSLNLRGLSESLMNDGKLLEQVRAANRHRLEHMPDRRQSRKAKINLEDFDHCVGGGRPWQSSKSNVFDSDVSSVESLNFDDTGGEEILSQSGITLPDYPATAADSVFADDMLDELVSPKVSKEEVTSARSWCRKRKDEIKAQTKTEMGVKRKHSKCEVSPDERCKNSRRRVSSKENLPSNNSSQQGDDMSVITEMSGDYETRFIQGLGVDGLLMNFEIGACPVESDSETEYEPEIVMRPRSPGCSLYGSDSEDEYSEMDTGVRTRITDIREVDEDELFEETQSATSMLSRTCRSEGGLVGESDDTEVNSSQIRNYYEDIRLQRPTRSITSFPRRPAVPEEKAPTPKSGGELLVRGSTPDVLEGKGVVRNVDKPRMLMGKGRTLEMLNDRNMPMYMHNVAVTPSLPGCWRGPSPVFGMQSNMNPPGLGFARGKANEGTTPRYSGGKIGVRPPAARFGEEDAKRAREALRLWNIIEEPANGKPIPLGEMFKEAVFALAKKGRKFVESLVRKGSFAAARQDQKSYERACRHHGQEVLSSEEDFLRALQKYECS